MNDEKLAWKVLRFLAKYLSLLTLIPLSILLLLPPLLSTDQGRALALAYLSKRLDGELLIDQLALHWFTPQKIRGFTYIGRDEKITIFCDEITLHHPLYRLIWNGDLGSLDCFRPRVVVRDLGDGMRDEISHHLISLVEEPSFPIQDDLIIPFSSLMIREGSLSLEGKRGEIADVYDLEASCSLQEKGLFTSLFLSLQGKSSFRDLKGSFDITSELEGKDKEDCCRLLAHPLSHFDQWQERPLNLDIRLNAIAVDPLDQLIAFQRPHLRGALLSILGPTLDLKLHHLLKNGERALSLITESKGLNGHLGAHFSDEKIRELYPNLLRVEISPEFFTYFAPKDDQGEQLLSLQERCELVLQLDRFSVEQTAWPFRLQWRLSPTSLQLTKKPLEELSIREMRGNIERLERYNSFFIDLQTTMNYRDTPSAFSFYGKFGEEHHHPDLTLKDMLKGDFTINGEKLPLSFVDALAPFRMDSFEDILGSELDLQCSATLHEEMIRGSLTLNSALLNLPEMKFRLSHLLELEEAAECSYWLAKSPFAKSSPFLLSSNFPLRITLDSCSLPWLSLFEEEEEEIDGLRDLFWKKARLSAFIRSDEIDLMIDHGERWTFKHSLLRLEGPSLSEIKLSFDGHILSHGTLRTLFPDEVFLTLSGKFSTSSSSSPSFHHAFLSLDGPNCSLEAAFEVAPRGYFLLTAPAILRLKIEKLATTTPIHLNGPVELHCAISRLALPLVKAHMEEGSYLFDATCSLPLLDWSLGDDSYRFQDIQWSCSLDSVDRTTSVTGHFHGKEMDEEAFFNCKLYGSSFPSLNLTKAFIDIEGKLKKLSLPLPQPFHLGGAIDGECTLSLHEGEGALCIQASQKENRLHLSGTISNFQLHLDETKIHELKLSLSPLEKSAVTFRLHRGSFPLERTFPFLSWQEPELLEGAVNWENISIPDYDGKKLLLDLSSTFKRHENGNYALLVDLQGSPEMKATLQSSFSLKGRRFSLSDLKGTCNLSLENCTTKPLDDLLDDAHPMKSLLGRKISTSLILAGDLFQGSLQLKFASSSSLEAFFDGGWRLGYLFLKTPAEITLLGDETLLPLMHRLSLPFLRYLEPTTEKLSLFLSPKGFSIPITFNQRELLTKSSLHEGRLELGKVQLKADGQLSLLLTLLDGGDDRRAASLPVWFTPIRFQLHSGKIELHRFDALIAERFPTAFWGEIDLLQDRVQLVVGLTEGTLRQAYGVDNLPKSYVLQIPWKGTLREMRIDRAKAMGQITALVAKTKAQPLYDLFDFLGGKDSSKQSPPPMDPLPWE